MGGALPQYGGHQGAGSVSCGLLGVVPRALWEPPCRRWKRFCSYFCKAAGLMPGTLPPTVQWPSWGALPPVLTQREAQRQPPPPSVAQRGGSTGSREAFREEFRESFREVFREALREAYRKTFREASGEASRQMFREAFRQAFRGAFRKAIQEAFRESFRESFRDAFR